MNIRNILIGAVSAAAVAAIAGSAAAQTSTGNSASADVTVNAKVIKALTISDLHNLNFGTVISPADTSHDTVSIDASNDRGASTAILVSDANNTPQAGSFKINGDQHGTFSTAVTPTADANYTLTPVLTSSDCTMNTSSLPTGTGAADSCTIKVGGSLKIPVGASGTLSGSKVTIVVTYN